MSKCYDCTWWNPADDEHPEAGGACEGGKYTDSCGSGDDDMCAAGQAHHDLKAERAWTRRDRFIAAVIMGGVAYDCENAGMMTTRAIKTADYLLKEIR